MAKKNVLDTFMSEIGKRKVVVTDRLHGMIFCAITGTPCVVFSNYNQISIRSSKGTGKSAIG